ncbi:YafY family transcriptional regulator [Occultella glacieicola]|uniref:YafY family transcriptional regulator n=1 Tax=Occultella glacieicola TaxID=2518684 RepID=A0ABY2E1N9_9MICO|nr:YafY family protein [Occultella glacieicola]TDE92515.1 YafY family transcriptional regulator [Occultella glacieicola]
MADTAEDRLVRMLALITYLEGHPSVPVADVAAHFGVTEGQVLLDIDTLWVAGTPGYLPDDLIDFSVDDHEQNRLTLTNARGMDRPLRLGPQEAVALLVALRSLQATPALAQDPVLASTIDKLRAAAGEAAGAADAVDVYVGAEDVGERLSALRSALADGRQVRLRYVSGSDVVSERVVDPLQLLTDAERWFLYAWCHRADGVRQFRLDRMLEVEVLDSGAPAHPDVALTGSTDPELTTAQWHVRLELASRARWVAEKYPSAAVTDLEEGWFAVELDVVNLAWLHNLVLGLGADVRAVQPPEVAESIAERAQAALDAYGALDGGAGAPQ